jgi:hypothetical protein
MIRRAFIRCVGLRLVARLSAYQRGIETAKRWHDRCADIAEDNDQLAVAVWHRMAAYHIGLL